MPLWLNGIDNDRTLFRIFRAGLMSAYDSDSKTSLPIACIVSHRLFEFVRYNNMIVFDGIVYSFEGNHNDSEAHLLVLYR